jgi:hypothetical protein
VPEAVASAGLQQLGQRLLSCAPNTALGHGDHRFSAAGFKHAFVHAGVRALPGLPGAECGAPGDLQDLLGPRSLSQ